MQLYSEGQWLALCWLKHLNIEAKLPRFWELEERHHDCEAELPRSCGTAGVAQPKVTGGKGRYSFAESERHRLEEESLFMTKETVYQVSTSVQGMTST